MSLIQFNLPLIAQQQGGKFQDHQTLGNLIGHSDTLVIAEAAAQFKGLTVVVTPDTRTALRLEKALKQFSNLPVSLFPDWETLPYDNFSPHQDIISARLSALFHLQQGNKQIFLLPISTLLQKVCPPSYLANNVLLIKKGDRFSIQSLRLQLENAGYRAVEQVLEYGEYAVRGALLDLYPMGADSPFRLDFFDDEIDSIRTFDVDSQRTIAEITEINLLPAHEFPTDSHGIEHFRSKFREQFGEIRREPEHIYQQVSKGILNAGIEYWQPLFFDEMASLFDYLPENTLFITFDGIAEKAEQFHKDTVQRYESRRVDPMRPLLPPEKLWFFTDEVNRSLKGYPRLTISADKVRKSTAKQNANIKALPAVALQSGQKEPFAQLLQFQQTFSGNIVFSVESEGRRETLLELLSPLKIKPKQIKNLAEIESQISLIISPLDQGFIVESNSICPDEIAIICETDLLGEKVQTKRTEKNRKTVNPDTLIRNLAELKIGQAVVHLENGVGRYAGLTVLDAGGIKAEYLVLHYANEAKLYVPVASLHLISRYIGGADETAPLHKLGSEAWAKTRQKAAEKIRDVAAELLDVYAKRESQKGFAFVYDRESFMQFASTFPFEETEDQKMAINAVISDMCLPKAMDRLVCGDVGFGKTEVAMRAIFLAVENHKQVAVLVPTTLLAQQHFENFKDRFANYPINVEVLSRFKTAKEQKAILAKVAEGKVDILVGTHKLLQEDVQFRDLGLLVIDEEHRFGVRQKEKIKQLRANVDILTLTATPIPRTLNMALNGMRDLSIIASPPARRLTIKTFVRQYDDLVVREAILREILRGGQVYYLHNDVATIENCAAKLAELVPEARIVIGHGQMRELERVMSDFYHQRFNLLVCSTIIETGIDVPSANTIIIDRADKFGLAQLHQLRGRVGRSHYQAYAYLLTPHPKMLTKDAQQRLEALSSIENLGAGFVLATHDLEIRGAGELLGSEQSGQIESIGFSLYMDLLENAVQALQEGREPTLDEITQSQLEVELRVPALLPDDYVPDVNMRLSFYKRIASSESAEALKDLKVELIDRFGLLPEATQNLFQITQLRHLASPLGLKKIEAGINGGYLEFKPTAQPDPMKFLQLIQSDKNVYKFEGAQKFRFNLPLADNKARLEFVEELIRKLV
ncbi:transcription-repair coupling factor [Actinobacillus vicugnae]|uniref:transcription-repair coupling factor n=1 Tax=Actinobacillus vicugnae TaxID=2573093 RepID=UPI00123F3A81|nr:transcription-repair coupling factor [Actinobacillus vicugnae]